MVWCQGRFNEARETALDRKNENSRPVQGLWQKADRHSSIFANTAQVRDLRAESDIGRAKNHPSADETRREDIWRKIRMNELQAPARMLVWIVGVIVALGLVGSLGKMTYRMAEAAIDAQQHDQMSWGKFSRQLWTKSNKK